VLANINQKDPQVKQASMEHVMTVQLRYLNLLTLLARINHTRLLTFPTKQHHFVEAINLVRIEPITLIIFEWPCQGLSQANIGQGLSNPMLGLFYELIHVVQYL
jgi:site-specific DNA-cytosine methylase